MADRWCKSTPLLSELSRLVEDRGPHAAPRSAGLETEVDRGSVRLLSGLLSARPKRSKPGCISG